MPEPLKLMPFRSTLAAGVPLAFSWDHPATDLSPWPSLAAAVARLDQTGAPVLPEEAIALPAALGAYGAAAARSLGVTGGTLEPGMPADRSALTGLVRDAAGGDPGDLSVLTPWRGGRVVCDPRRRRMALPDPGRDETRTVCPGLVTEEEGGEEVT